jgi:hypothetical protein
MNDITLIGYNRKIVNGIARYSNNLYNNIPNINYRDFYRKEIIKNNKKYFGYLSGILYQPFYKINTKIIHTLSTALFYYKANVSTIHDLYFDNNRYKLSKINFLPMILKYKLGKLKIIVPSELVLSQFKQMYGSVENVYVVPHGIDYNYIDSLNLSNPFKTENNIVIAGGVDFKRRNQRILLDKLKKIDYNVYVVGYGFIDILKNEYKDYNNIHFIKSPSDTEFYSYLKYSDLNLYNTVGEGFGYIIYESLYLGKKMLVNYNIDNMKLFRQYADYYEIDNLMEKIEKYFDKRSDMKDDLIKNYSIKNMVEKTLDVYNHINF